MIEKRYCIDVTSTTSNPQDCEGEQIRVINCRPQQPCPEEDNINAKEGVCQDLDPATCSTSVKAGAGRAECRQLGNHTWMSDNCKKTCQFCVRKYFTAFVV